MTPTITKTGSVRELGSVDTKPLKNIVQRLSDKVWDLEDQRKENDFFCFHHTQHIIFRFIGGNRNHRDFYSTHIWAIYQQVLLPVMNKVVEPYNFAKPVYPKAMLARLEAGHIIDEHIDGAGSNLHTHKIHIPLYTNPKVTFFVDNQPYHLKEGCAYEVNNVTGHAVENFGETDRIHFIFEVFDGAE